MPDSDSLLAAMKARAPGYYTERDGGDWYCLTPAHQRLGEDFAKRDDARKLILWIAGGDDMPARWRLLARNDLFAELDCGQGYPAVLWVREVEALFPGRLPAVAEEHSHA